MRFFGSARHLGIPAAALALAGMFGAELHEAVHLLEDPTHCDARCTACQAAHGAGLPCAAPASVAATPPGESAPAVPETPVRPPRVHKGHPRGPPSR